MKLYREGQAFQGEEPELPIELFFISSGVFLPHRTVGFAMGALYGLMRLQEWDNIKKEWRNR